MAVIRCRKCRGFLARLTGTVGVLRIVRHGDEVAPPNEVLRCGSCGTVHEIQRHDEAA